MNWDQYCKWSILYVQRNPYPIQIFKNLGITFIPSEKVYNAALYLHNELPASILEKISKIPGIGTKELKKNVKKLKMVN